MSTLIKSLMPNNNSSSSIRTSSINNNLSILNNSSGGNRNNPSSFTTSSLPTNNHQLHTITSTPSGHIAFPLNNNNNLNTINNNHVSFSSIASSSSASSSQPIITTTSITTSASTTSTTTNVIITIDPILEQFYKYICEYNQITTHEDFDKEIQQLEERLNRGLKILKETFKDKEFKKEFKNYWMNENSQSTRLLLIYKICNHIYNSIESLEYQSFEYDKIDQILFNLLCKDLNILNLISKKEYCIRKDEEIITEHLNYLNLKFNREIIKAICLFKKLVQYFVMNGIIILYKSIKQAQF